MSGVIIAPGLVVNAGEDNLNADSPIIGYQNLVDSGNVTATTEDTDFPITNIANPSTALRWKSAEGSPSSEEYLTVILDTSDDVDYLAIARHNFGTLQTPVSVEGTNDPDMGSPADWFELIGDTLLPNDSPTIFRFTPQPLYAIRLRIQESLLPAQSVPPSLAVMYVGKLLVLQRRIYVGHTPLPYGRKLMVANHRSISGNFLGRVVLGEMTGTTVDLKNLTPDWYRANFEPFLQAAKEIPFFFGWRPGTYPYESGYAWLAGDPQPQNQLANGMMQISFELEGTVS